ncbi:MAG TPA: lysophospholipase, partial [Acidobacteriaceae bacterium]|nr:lysophospholipase [Acidobacteriaceae bacterium]
APLSTLTTPKLIITYNTSSAPAIALHAADPKVTAEFPTRNDVACVQTLTRFLDLYAPTGN